MQLSALESEIRAKIGTWAPPCRTVATKNHSNQMWGHISHLRSRYGEVLNHALITNRGIINKMFAA